MGGVRKKKGRCGEATMYINRNKAVKLLQISLADFRRLCILKGVYPREPNSRKKAQHGDSNIRTLYLKRDITYLSHEANIWKIRDEKIHRREKRTLHAKKQFAELEFKNKHQRPSYKLDHMVLERYPTFDKALMDLDDPLSTCFLYAVVPNVVRIDMDLIHSCRRLTTEFLNYVIESRSLRKTFITIKGYYYRADIHGHKVTWMVPHPFVPEIPMAVDMGVMKVFVEFYVTLLGFINLKLYQSLNMYYPPKLPYVVKKKLREDAVVRKKLKEGAASSKAPADKRKREKRTPQGDLEVIQALAAPLRRRTPFEGERNDEDEEDDYDMNIMTPAWSRKMSESEEERAKVKAQKRLFEGVKFFLGRETNRESLAFVVRAAGGKVSWPSTCSPGALYGQDDPGITYEIVDRPETQVHKKFLSRYYVQPQWLYDSFNACLVLPVKDYFVGCSLPAHLSPFEETFKGRYDPPEMLRLRQAQNKLSIVGDKGGGIFLEDDGEEEEEGGEGEEGEEGEMETGMNEMEDTSDKEDEEEVKEEEKKKGDVENKGESEKEGDETKGESETKGDEIKGDETKGEETTTEEPKDPLAKMSVKKGRAEKRNVEQERKAQAWDDERLATILIHRKQKRLYKRLKNKEKHDKYWAESLKRKRLVFEREMRRRREGRKKREEEGEGEGEGKGEGKA